MLYLYDKAICEDLERSFDPDHIGNSAVRVIDPQGAITLAAQIQNDEIQFPLVSVVRSEEPNIDKDRMNFTLAHKGFPSVFDNETNSLYFEKRIPINLSYNLTILATNTADKDELLRELLMKYLDMYYLRITLPYESNRFINFGVRIDQDGIENSSGSFEYISGGKLYQCIIPLKCEGCMLVNYTPRKLKRYDTEVNIVE